MPCKWVSAQNPVPNAHYAQYSCQTQCTGDQDLTRARESEVWVYKGLHRIILAPAVTPPAAPADPPGPCTPLDPVLRRVSIVTSLTPPPSIPPQLPSPFLFPSSSDFLAPSWADRLGEIPPCPNTPPSIDPLPACPTPPSPKILKGVVEEPSAASPTSPPSLRVLQPRLRPPLPSFRVPLPLLAPAVTPPAAPADPPGPRPVHLSTPYYDECP